MQKKQLLKSKKILLGLAFSSSLFLINCASSNGDKPEQTEATVPSELKDSTVLQVDEDNALDKLNNVIDTTKKEK